MPSIAPVTSTGLTITNPLVLYRALLATKRIDPDPSQHRLALHLQKLYHRLKDYEPTVEYRTRLRQINRAVGGSAPPDGLEHDSPPVTLPRKGRHGLLASLLAQKERRDTLALTQVLTSQEEALRLDSPRGLLLYGEVGTGKSMLVDLLADCLPNRKKRRWHFNTFMLETFSRLEQLRRSQAQPYDRRVKPLPPKEEEYSLLVLARDMISTSPIIFLDEFQLPDRAASKILLNLLTSFFQLGGVLVATSNRMPDELAEASGVEFAPPPATPGMLGWKTGKTWGGGRREQDRSSSGGKGEFAGFLEVLKARCEVWDMEGAKDWRRREAEGETSAPDVSPPDGENLPGLEEIPSDDLGLGYEQSKHDSAIHLDGVLTQADVTSSTARPVAPKNYLVDSLPSSESKSQREQEEAALHSAFPSSHTSLRRPPTSQIPWEPTALCVYNRTVSIPQACNGVAMFTFADLCTTNLGPADYITLASTFHTLVLTDIPVLTLLHKNEARRLITLLDALYEARCKLLILRAAAGPDDLFFPETKTPLFPSDIPPPRTRDTDALYAETIAEIHQDATSPFRPNISAYQAAAPSTTWRSVLADEDSDFGPIPGAGNEIGRTLDFSHAAAYTGEDERFAYKRAASRLWEMCGTRWWARGGRDGDVTEWWRPLAVEGRSWEGQRSVADGGAKDVGANVRREGEEAVFRHGASPFRVSEEPPPRIWGGVHAWGMMRWGKKAGRWGKGAEAFADEERGEGGGGKS